MDAGTQLRDLDPNLTNGGATQSLDDRQAGRWILSSESAEVPFTIRKT
jgi:hypothetical protein